jgi:hypothetical protein
MLSAGDAPVQPSPVVGIFEYPRERLLNSQRRRERSLFFRKFIQLPQRRSTVVAGFG